MKRFWDTVQVVGLGILVIPFGFIVGMLVCVLPVRLFVGWLVGHDAAVAVTWWGMFCAAVVAVGGSIVWFIEEWPRINEPSISELLASIGGRDEA